MKDIKRVLIIFFCIIGAILLLYIGAGWILTFLNTNSAEELNLAEKTMISRYDSLFKDTVMTSMNKDWEAEDKSYKYRYGHGIYYITFQTKPSLGDFKRSGDSALSAISIAAVKTFLPMMPHRELYDSVSVTFITRYPDSTDPVTKRNFSPQFTKIFTYYAR